MHRVDGGGAPGGDEASDGGDEDKEHGREQECEGIAGTAASPRCHDAIEGKTQNKADSEADTKSEGRGAEHETNDARTLRTQAHANAHFLGALCDGIGDDAIKAGGSKDQRERGE